MNLMILKSFVHVNTATRGKRLIKLFFKKDLLLRCLISIYVLSSKRTGFYKFK